MERSMKNYRFGFIMLYHPIIYILGHSKYYCCPTDVSVTFVAKYLSKCHKSIVSKLLSVFIFSLLCLCMMQPCLWAEDLKETATSLGATPKIPRNVTHKFHNLVLKNWRLSGDYLRRTENQECAQIFGQNDFILGLSETNCLPGDQGARASVQLPKIKEKKVGILRIKCQGGCDRAITTGKGGGEIKVRLNGKDLWTAECDPGDGFGPLSLRESLAIAFAANANNNNEISLEASTGVLWPIASVTLELRNPSAQTMGIAYSPFRDCQNPSRGIYPSVSEINEDMVILQHMGNSIRTYSALGVLGKVPEIASRYGLKVHAGAWLGKDREKNEKEIKALLELSKKTSLESVIVGNEVLLRGDMSENSLIQYIQRVKKAVDVPVTSADIGHILLDHPNLMKVLDYYLIHYYAYWDGQPIETAARYVVDLFHKFKSHAAGKRVIIGETGWPSAGSSNGSAIPSLANQRKYIIEFLTLAHLERIEFFYFAAFDELWKTEGGVGPFWGMMYADRRNKYDLQSVLIPFNQIPASERKQTIEFPKRYFEGQKEKESDETFSIYTNYQAESNHFSPSGWMGDIHAIHLNDCARVGEAWSDRKIRIEYTPSPKDEAGWAGIYWLDPPNNWGKIRGAGHDLRGHRRLRFRAMSETSGTEAKFFTGGVDTGPFPSSLKKPLFAAGADSQGFIQLTDAWREYYIDLQNADLSRVIDGFGWAADRERTPSGMVIYLDDIVFDREVSSYSVNDIEAVTCR
jgi:exo-beta-1,3-glucanase (GH17 family)